MTMPCYLCRSTHHTVRPGKVRDNPALKVLECDCGLVYLSDFSHATPEHYAKSGMHGSDPLPVDQWLAECAQDDDRRFRMLKPAGSNLDFGCGAGGFLLRSGGHGVELEERLQPHFKANGLTVYRSLEEAGKYDLITAFHVIEHLPDPKTTLRELAEHLNPGGEIVIEVPSANDALLTIYECEAFQNFTYWSQHLFLFNTITLAAMVRQAGLTLKWTKQVQRYPLSNHLYWLAKGKPGGHKKWGFLDSPDYDRRLAEVGVCDTVMAGIC